MNLPRKAGANHGLSTFARPSCAGSKMNRPRHPYASYEKQTESRALAECARPRAQQVSTTTEHSSTFGVSTLVDVAAPEDGRTPLLRPCPIRLYSCLLVTLCKKVSSTPFTLFNVFNSFNFL